MCVRAAQCGKQDLDVLGVMSFSHMLPKTICLNMKCQKLVDTLIYNAHINISSVDKLY